MAYATAPGYLEAVAFIGRDQYRHLRRERRTASAVAARSTPDLRIELYREPHPYFVVIVPDGYRGLLRLDLSAPGPERVLAVGERAVEVAVQPPAPQKLPRCRLGGHVIGYRHFTARYADGTPLPSGTRNGDDIALRYVVARNMRYIYVIGTEADVQAARVLTHEPFENFDEPWDADAAAESALGYRARATLGRCPECGTVASGGSAS